MHQAEQAHRQRMQSLRNQRAAEVDIYDPKVFHALRSPHQRPRSDSQQSGSNAQRVQKRGGDAEELQKVDRDSPREAAVDEAAGKVHKEHEEEKSGDVAEALQALTQSVSQKVAAIEERQQQASQSQTEHAHPPPSQSSVPKSPSTGTATETTSLSKRPPTARSFGRSLAQSITAEETATMESSPTVSTASIPASAPGATTARTSSKPPVSAPSTQPQQPKVREIFLDLKHLLGQVSATNVNPGHLVPPSSSVIASSQTLMNPGQNHNHNHNVSSMSVNTNNSRASSVYQGRTSFAQGDTARSTPQMILDDGTMDFI